MLTILWTEADMPITFKKRYNFWRKQCMCDVLTSGFLALLGSFNKVERS